MTGVPLVRMSGMTKRFERVLAVDNVSLDLMPGQVHALVGENGAGKTVLMSLLYGVHQPDSGEISVNGQPMLIRRPADAIEAGIALVYQHFKLVPSFTVLENLMLVEHRRLGMVPDRKAFAAGIIDIGEQYGLEVNPNARISELPLGLRQRVEILGGLVRNARVLILDEPTTILAPTEIDGLFATVRRIAEEGRAVVLITHRLPEVFEIGDVFSVMRNGRLMATGPTAESSPERVAELMVGREMRSLSLQGSAAAGGETVLDVSGISLPPDEASPGLTDVTFRVRDSEIVAIAGVEGNGQSELVQVLAGIRHPQSGRLLLGGEDITNAPRRTGAQRGLAIIPEDRHAEGLILPMTLTENVTISRIRQPEYSKAGFWLYLSRLRAFASRMIERFHIHAPSEAVPVRMLSGGNQQKVVLARELSSNPRVLVAAEPTRGLDIAATDYVLRQLSVARDEGTAVLLISSDLDQLLSVADRILVFFRGSVVADLDAAAATREEIGRYMSGVDLVAAGRASLPREPGDAEPADDPVAGQSDSPAKSNGA